MHYLGTILYLVSPAWKRVLSRNVTQASKSANTKKNAVLERHKLEKLMFGGVIETKKAKTKRVKASGKVATSVTAEEIPDTEEQWLTQLGSKDIKVYRKTTTGRYKAVDKDKLLSCAKRIVEDLKKEEEPPKIVLPEIIVKNVTSVPMLSIRKDPDVRSKTMDYASYPAVTRILTDTMSDSAKAALENWKQKMVAELGPEGFSNFNREQLSFGSRFHACVRSYLQGINPNVDHDLHPVWDSVKNVLPNISNVRLVESNVAHSKLLYKGVVDCVASYKDVPSVIEWKVSQKQKSDLRATFDAPLQVTAYLGALSHDADYRTSLKNGLVVVAYKDGSPASAFSMDEQLCLKSWSQWVKRLQLYWQNSNHNI